MGYNLDGNSKTFERDGVSYEEFRYQIVL
jgi:hypothetical protein